ncbi:MAG: nucleotidyltransferase, partial [bacterium]
MSRTDALLLGTVLEMELSDRDHQVASKRYNLIPDHLQRPTSPIRQHMENALVYPQGSRAIG